MGSLTNPFPVPVLRREGHFDVQLRTPSGTGIHIDHYGPSIFPRFVRYARSRLALISLLRCYRLPEVDIETVKNW